MRSHEIFDSKAKEYDGWYEKHPALYLSELHAVKSFECRNAVEIGVGTGRFTRDTGVTVGVDPSLEMLKLAPKSLNLVQGVGERLPLRSDGFDCSLLVVTLCFVEDPVKVLKEAARVSEKVIACIVPRDSPWGKHYSKLAEEGNPFYVQARFYTVSEIIKMASRMGLKPNKIMGVLKRGPGIEILEKPATLSADEAERYGFVCIELYRKKMGKAEQANSSR